MGLLLYILNKDKDMTRSISRLLFGDNYCDLQVTDSTCVRTEDGFFYNLLVVVNPFDATIAQAAYEAYENKGDWEYCNPSYDDYEGGFYPAWDIEGHFNPEGVEWFEYLTEGNTLKGITATGKEVLLTHDKGNYKLGYMVPGYSLEYYLEHGSGATVLYYKNDDSWYDKYSETYVHTSCQPYGYYKAWPLSYKALCEGIVWSEELPKSIEEEFVGTNSYGASVALTKSEALAYYVGDEKVAEYKLKDEIPVLTVTTPSNVEGFCASWRIPEQYEGYGLAVSDLQLAISLGIVLHSYDCGNYYGVHPLGTVTLYKNGKFKGEGFYPPNMEGFYPREVWAKYHPTYGWIPWDCNVDNGLVVEGVLPPEGEGWAIAVSAEEPPATIYRWDTKVPKELNAHIPDTLCLGLEAEFSDYTARSVYNATLSVDGKALFKWDSSCGIELVTIPLAPEDMIQFINGLKIAQMEANSNCGVHIHLSRKYLTQCQLGGLVVFMNHPDNLDYIIEVAGRLPNRFCKVKPNKADTVSTDRYEMVNLTNSATVEVRIFAGTNSTDILRGYVEWLLQLIEWLATNPSSYLATEFIKHQRKVCLRK